jgi:hypothetical protein
MLDDAERGLGGEALAPARLVDQVGELHLGPAGDGPGKKAAAAEEGTAPLLDRRPEAELRMARVALEEPLQLVAGLLEGARSVGYQRRISGSR